MLTNGTKLHMFLLLVMTCSIVSKIPTSTVNWIAVSTASSVSMFSNRNGHASCVFNGSIWVVGGRSVSYPMYNLISSVRTADVWYSVDGATWNQEVELEGDFYAQNFDAKTPGDLAPWYPRFGHTLDTLDRSAYNLTQDLMILIGGYSPDPSNDVWISPNGRTWYYTGLAPWGPRAFHSSTLFQGHLWIIGGSPLNNEVWRLDSVQAVYRTNTPLTRAMYMKSTYALQWSRHPDERMVVVGGYGGWPEDSPLYTGISCMADVWAFNGTAWRQLTAHAAFGSRAWFALKVLHGADPKQGVGNTSSLSPKMFLFAGGNIGNSTRSNMKYLSMEGKVDAYWSRGGSEWTKISYDEGGNPSVLPRYSSQEWTHTVVNAASTNLGLWGASMVLFNPVRTVNFTTSRSKYNGFFLIGGDYTDSGPFSSTVFQSQSGILCDYEGVPCNDKGVCGKGYSGCKCNSLYSGDTCQTPPPAAPLSSEATKGHVGAEMLVCVSVVLSVLYLIV